MDPLSTTASIIATIQLSSEVVKYVNAAAGATNQRKRLREEVRTCEYILQQLKDGADDSEEGKAWSRTIEALQGPKGPLGRLDVTLQTIQAKLLSKEGHKKVLETLKWPFTEREVEKILAAIEREKSLLWLALENDHRKLTLEIKKTSTEFKRQLTGLVDGLGRIEGSQADLMCCLHTLNDRQNNREATDRTRQILNWLSPVDPSTSHCAAMDMRVTGTNDWLLSYEEFKFWRHAKSSVLWLTGILGSGKTVLVSTVIDFIQQCGNQNDRTYVAYFYCDFRSPETRNPLNLVGSLIAQICTQLGRFPKDLEEVFERNTSTQSPYVRQTDLRTLSEILMLLTSKHHVIILVDALDECESRRGILELFRLLGTQGHHLNILLSSRDEADIRHVLSDFPRIRLESVSNCLNSDIDRYINYRLDHDPGFRMLKLKPSFRETILQSLRVQANGMFFWVRCQLDEIAQLKTMKDIREALKTLPKGLHETYENILVKIPSGTIRIVRQLLQWLVCTVSPLSLTELHESLAIEPNMDHICEEAALLISPEDIQDLCGNLIVVTAKGNVMLAHLSVKDYLLSVAIKRSRASIFAFSESEANIQNALSCLTYLSFADFRSGPAGSADDFESRLLRYPFLYHASIWWAAYVRNANLFSEELSNKALRFFSPSCRTIFMSWVQVICSRPMFGNKREYTSAIKERKLCWNAYPRQATSLYYAASFGLEYCVRALLSQGAEIDAEGGRLGATAFHAAALRGHVNVMDMLFAEGADPNRTDVIKMAPLHSAALAGNVEVIKRLLKQGADPCAKDEYGSTPYDLAYSMGHTDALNHLHMNKSKEMEDIGPSSIRVMHTIRGEVISLELQATPYLYRRYCPSDSSKTKEPFVEYL
ncbi:hypothetical protein NW758_003932 [Fusarium oxysporum]|nr:hypothetical protein NW758_003932 [Fusarium oxysporum]